MKLQLFTVYDSAAAAFLDPFPAPTVEVAIRQFRLAVNKPNHQFGTFPEDYTLFHIGEFDQSSGVIAASSPRSLGVAITFMDSDDHGS